MNSKMVGKTTINNDKPQDRGVVERITEILDSEDWTQTNEFAELATEYATACTRMNERLAECRTHVDNGDFDAAQEAWDKAPKLTATVAMLDFPRAKDWRELCELYELSIAPSVDVALFNELRTRLQEQERLEPLLKKYRAVVHRGSTVEKLELLRLIHEKTEEKSVWKKELEKIERQRFRELADGAKKAIIGADRDSLEIFYRELMNTQWTVVPDERVLRKTRRELDKLCIRDLRKQADATLRELAEAYGDFDLDATTRLITEWDELCDEPLFEPEDTDATQVEDARNWALEEHESARRQARCDKHLSLLTQALEDHEFEDARKCMLKLEHEAYQIPEHLQQRFKALESEHELKQSRTFTLRLAMFAIAALLLAIAGFMAVNAYVKQRRIHHYVAEISACLKSGSIESARELLNKIEAGEPDLLASPKLARMVGEVANGEAGEAKRLARFEEMMAELKALNASNFEDENAAKNAFIQAQEMARLNDERARVAEVRVVFDKISGERQKVRDEAYVKACNELMKSIEQRLLIRNLEDDVAAYGRHLDELSAELLALVDADGISEDLKKEYDSALYSMINGAARRYNDAKSKRKKIDSMLAEMWNHLTPLDEYEKHLDSFLQAFVTEKEAEGLQQVMRKMQYYRAAAMLQEFSPTTATEKQVHELAKRMEEHPQCIWRDDFEVYSNTAESLLPNFAAAKETVESLESAPDFNPKYGKLFLYRFEDRQGRVVSKLLKDVQSYSAGDSYQYVGQLIDDRETFESGRQDGTAATFKGDGSGFSWRMARANDADQKNNEKLKCVLHAENFAPAKLRHAEVAKRIVFGLKDVPEEEFEAFILKQVTTIIESPCMAARVKLIAIRHLLSVLETVCSEDAKSYYATHVRNIDDICQRIGETDWIKAELDANTSKTMYEFLDGLPDFYQDRERAVADYNVRQHALGRMLTPVGVVAEPGQVKFASPELHGKANELWILDVDVENNAVRFVIVGEHGRLDENHRELQQRGVPLFSPLDERSTKALAEKLKRANSHLRETKNWPVSWPINAR